VNYSADPSILNRRCINLTQHNHHQRQRINDNIKNDD